MTSYGMRIHELAVEYPGRVALVCEEGSLTREELDTRANRLAHSYAQRGLGEGDIATLMLPNGLELVAACIAVWKLGAIPNPLSDRLPDVERDGIIERAAPRLVIGTDEVNSPGIPVVPAGFDPSRDTPTHPPEAAIPPFERALASGGSTGAPKLIVATNPAVYDFETASPLFKARGGVLVPGPLYHAAPFSAAFQGLLAGGKVVLMRRFDAERTLELIEEHEVERMFLVPTMMQRIWRLPESVRNARNVSSLQFVMTGGAPCPKWLMRAWIDWLGPDVMAEAFGPSERIGGTFITGREWLEHPGSVGKPISGGRLKILDDDGRECPPGVMGEIYMLPAGGPGSTYRYIGAESRVAGEGWESVGDMGMLDESGYLYLGDRRSDMILCGGRNIYPAEVEAAIDRHPQVAASAVIGLPDDDLGLRIHAIVECPDDLDPAALREHVAEQLVHYKVPGSFEFVRERLRDDAGKVRRSALRAERVGGA